MIVWAEEARGPDLLSQSLNLIATSTLQSLANAWTQSPMQNKQTNKKPSSHFHDSSCWVLKVLRFSKKLPFFYNWPCWCHYWHHGGFRSRGCSPLTPPAQPDPKPQLSRVLLWPHEGLLGSLLPFARYLINTDYAPNIVTGTKNRWVNKTESNSNSWELPGVGRNSW